MENAMTDAELDTVYTRLCKTMTQVGEANAPMFLARFALLAIGEIGDADVSLKLIEAAGDGESG
ncbi:hypothetical protein K788_0000775 [Paraburkholderia caribensis MBA4]|uniref:DUF2783 domain-containing protein n=2 Tax=Paraburkholderia caribensis TaxID=75105 RepID=A0A0P0RHR5_9BURK|nr:hypothetical protein K788_0000775 [Paraburkholderia caribensis MBA4]